jgi:hypothetical protein
MSYGLELNGRGVVCCEIDEVWHCGSQLESEVFGESVPQTIDYMHFMLRAGRKGASGTQGDRGTMQRPSMK